MSDNTEKKRNHRKSSILKNVVGNGDSPTETFSRRSKRISFSHVHNVKEFRADGDNRTIWGESYAKEASGSSEPCHTAVTSDQLTAQKISFVAPAPTIDLFADIDDVSEADVEMEVSSQQSQSHTKLFNQTMFIEETTSTSVTTCKLVDMSMVGNTNKRKTTETITVDKVTTDVTKSVKIRKMNDENLEPMGNHTIFHPVANTVSKPSVNLNATRIFDVDADLSDASEVPQNQILTKCMPSTISRSDAVTSKMFDKTFISPTDMTIDDQSISTSISDSCKPIGNKTYIYERGDISAGIDQTLAVRNPLLENNISGRWEEIGQRIDENVLQNYQMESMDVAAFQSKSDLSPHGTLEDWTFPNIQFKDRTLSPNLHETDEQGIEDLTISMDTSTKFKADVSDEDVSDVQLTKTKVNSLQKEPKEALLLGPTDEKMAGKQRSNNVTNKIPGDMTLCSVVDDDRTVHRRERTMHTKRNLNLSNDNLPKEELFDGTAAHDRVAATTDFSFANSEPLSSTRFVSTNKLNFSNSDANIKANSSSVTFNYCPTQTARRHSVASLQNNTDELCNLEPDQLRKRSDMKKLFLDLSRESSHDMLSETKMDLVDISVSGAVVDNESNSCSGPSTNPFIKHNFPATEPTTSVNEQNNANGPVSEADGTSNDNATENRTELYTEPRCRKCLNCRKSVDGNQTSFLKIEQLDQPKLDFSMYNQFKGLASIKDVIAARKKREAIRELQNQLLVDQNVEAPDIRFLWENKNENSVEPTPVYVPEPLTCYPMRMNIQYLMRNKVRTEYTEWKYFDNFFYIGAIALRNAKIPSIRIHIKFDATGPMKADKLNMPLLFNRVFIEECPTYLRRISPKNFLMHKHALALLPLNLTSLVSDSDNIYNGLSEIDKYFQSVVAKVNELESLTVEQEAFLRMEDRQCFIEKSVFDTQKYLMQGLAIKLDKIDTVGPKNVFFQPVCDTTNDFKTLPIGMPFLRTFLTHPKSYLLPFLKG